MGARFTDVEELLRRFPKTRPPLPEAHRKVYVEEYRANREGANLASAIATKLEQWMHRRVAALQGPRSVLEIGAGTLNHLPYERAHAAYDVVEPFVELYAASEHRGRVRRFYASTGEIEGAAVYDRILSIAVLEHMTDLPRELAHACRLLRQEGVFQAGFPTEGGALWGCAWRFGTGIAYRLRTGLDYAELMRHEHVNREKEIVAVAAHFFDDVRVERFPLPARHLSLYTYLEARRPRIDRSARYLQNADGLGSPL
ncbi:MAG TPA: methyltransferase domain-containing protein [Burkholderiales bacterium]|nr:MAG: methyltransferase type 12 [Pseudomonadota bacterium]